AISMTPTARRKFGPLTGRNFAATGLRYMLQSVRMLKNLSSPARNGPSPSPIRSAHQTESSFLFAMVHLTRLDRASRRDSVTRPESRFGRRNLPAPADSDRVALSTIVNAEAVNPGESNAFSDEEVVQQVLAGQVDLFEALMRRYNQRVFRLV